MAARAPSTRATRDARLRSVRASEPSHRPPVAAEQTVSEKNLMFSYACFGPALLVLPLFAVSVVNLFVAGPPLKTIVLESSGSSYGASLPFMKLDVAGSVAKFTLMPKDEMTHFFVVTCYSDAHPSLALDAVVRGAQAEPLSSSSASDVAWHALAHAKTAAPTLPMGATKAPPRSRLQLLQPMLGFKQYEVELKTLPPTPTGVAPNLPAVEYRLTYGMHGHTALASVSVPYRHAQLIQ